VERNPDLVYRISIYMPMPQQLAGSASALDAKPTPALKDTQEASAL
jgi:hypothetical protein